MATFELEDLVEVSEYANKRSILWQDGNEKFCGKICKVVGIGEDPDTGVPFLQLSYKGHRAWFSSDSVIKSSKYDEERQEWWDQKAKELQEWEDKKKKSTDDMLKEMFGLKKEPADTEDFFSDPSNYLDNYEYEYDEDADLSEEAADNWEETTDPCLIIPTKASLNPATVNNIKSGLSVMTDEELEELVASISGMLPEEQD